MQNAEWLSFVRSNPCINCGVMWCDVHHVARDDDRRRVDDSVIVPLCRNCHHKLHLTNDDQKRRGYYEHHAKRLKDLFDSGMSIEEMDLPSFLKGE